MLDGIYFKQDVKQETALIRSIVNRPRIRGRVVFKLLGGWLSVGGRTLVWDSGWRDSDWKGSEHGM